MPFTATTVPFILLFGLLWRLTKGNVLAIVLFTCVFAAASAFNFGAFGVAPWLLALAIGLCAKLLKGHGRFRLMPGANRTAFTLLMIFLGYAVWSGLAYPFVFHGAPALSSHDTSPAPLVWSVSNFAQICYLLAAAAVYLLGVSSSREELSVAMKWYVRGCVVAAAFSMYQLANAVFHIPYPYAVIYSNPSHVIYHAYQTNGMWRLNSTFDEASEMACYTSVGVALLGWDLLTLPLRVGRLVCFILMLVALLFTVSTLGYLCLAFMLVCGGALYFGRILQERALSPVKFVTAVTMIAIFAVTLTLSSAPQTVNKAVTSILLDKKDSESYRERTESNMDALDTLTHTDYMGAGWGSVRASGLTFMLLGTTGVLGITLFSLFLASLCWPLFHRDHGPTRAEPAVYRKSLFALAVMIVGLLAAGTEPVAPILWALFAAGTASHPVMGQVFGLQRIRRLTS